MTAGDIPAPGSGDRRSFLFLQGPLSPLYARLADRLEAAGHTVQRINLCFGDQMHWRRGGAIPFRGRITEWATFVADRMAASGTTDLVLHGDRRIYHRLAARAARRRGVRVIVTELGYLRPDWMTIERDATGAASHLPRDPAAIRELARALPALDPAPRYPSRFWKVAAPDVVYNLANVLAAPLYPHYRRHTIYHPVPEYLSWIGRLASARRRDRAAEALLADLKTRGVPVFVLALQLEGDFQIRDRSPFRGQAEAISLVAASFAQAAPATAELIVKTHPLDNGRERFGVAVADAARRHGLAGRLHFADGGRLDAFLVAAKGLVTINSSAGIEALRAGIPVKALAPAIYGVEGLVHGGTLDGFWSAPRPPDPSLLADYVKVLVATVQVRGTIYDDAGLEAAVDGMARRILDDRLNAPMP